MAQSPLPHTRAVQLQHLVAVLCIGVLSVVYLLGYIQWNRDPSGQASALALSPAVPSVASAQLAYAPDVPPASTRDGMAPVISRIDTAQPVVFLTIDDGVYKEPAAAANMRELGVPASLFLTQQYTISSWKYFNQLAHQTYSTIQNHTVNHRNLPKLSLAEQQDEICAASDSYAKAYATRSTLFRPPYGNFNTDTQRAVAACGMRAVVLWSALVEDGTMRYQVGSSLRPGDIVLMHFTPAFNQDLKAFVEASRSAGLRPQLLDDWLVP